VSTNVLELGASQSRDIERRVQGGDVSLVRGRGRLAGAHRVSVDLAEGGERQLDADYALIATGSTARVLPFFEPDGDRVLVGHQVYGLPEVPEHLIVVGSGATGAEFANAFRRFGAAVTLVSSRDLILPTEDPDAAQVIEAVFERGGMRILRNARAVSCQRRDDGVVVGLKDGGEVEGSHVLFTVGQVPSSQDIGLETCDVEVNAWGGVDVDSVGRTSAGWIYAAGDVTGRVMLANVAAMQGRTAMWHALGQAVQPIRWDAVTSTIFTTPEVATVGWSPVEAESAGFPVETARLDFRSNPRAKMIHGMDGFVKVHAMVGSGTVVGGVVVSSRASDLIQPLAVAVQNRLSVAQLAQTMTVYPSMAGSVAECARMLMARLDPQRR
jgi:NAD(P)H dehydrogenase (quinone)